MTDNIPELIERLRSKATDCHISEEPLYVEAAAALSRLTVSPLPKEIAEDIERLRDLDVWIDHGPYTGFCSKTAAALERMARELEVTKRFMARDAEDYFILEDRAARLSVLLDAAEAERERLLAVATELDDHFKKAETERDAIQVKYNNLAAAHRDLRSDIEAECKAIRAKTFEECEGVICRCALPESDIRKLRLAIRAFAGKDKSE